MENRECGAITALFNEYLDNTLPAGQVWTVEKHLAACADCAQLAREMRATIDLMQAAPHLDTGDDFMARLHARLDELEPEATRPRSSLEAARDWLRGGLDALRVRRVPALSFGLAVSALAAFWLLPVRAPQTDSAVPPRVTTVAQEPLRRNVALAASNPFEDPAAANLQAQTATSDANAADAENQTD